MSETAPETDPRLAIENRIGVVPQKPTPKAANPARKALDEFRGSAAVSIAVRRRAGAAIRTGAAADRKAATALRDLR